MDYLLFPTEGPAPVEGTVSIQGGEAPHEGFLMVYHNSQWGHVCDDLFDSDAVSVACRQMGYTGGEMVEGNSDMGPIEDQIWLDNVWCMGQVNQ